jgi:hypothetical protein
VVAVGVWLVFLCGNLVTPFWRWRLLFGYSHDRVKALAGVTNYTGMEFPPGTRLVEGEIVDSFSSGSAIHACLMVPAEGFTSFTGQPRYQGILERGDAAVAAYSAQLWPEVRARWNLPFTGRGVVGGRKYAEPGFIAREGQGEYTVYLWEWH